MILGSYYASMGDKRRVAIPKKFLDELGNSIILSKWYEGSLILAKTDFWQKISQRLTGDSKIITLGVRDIERFVLGSAFEVEPDAQGRIIVPEDLAVYAGFTKDIVFIGLGDRVEVWADEIWKEKIKSIETTTREYIEELAKNERK